MTDFLDPWYQLFLEVPACLSDAVSGLVFNAGSCGVQVEDGPDAGHACLTAYFEASRDPAQVTAELRHGLRRLIDEGLPHADELRAVQIRMEGMPQEDWSLGWRGHFKPVFPTPRIVVCPPWDRAPEPEGGCTVVIEPKMAFGTGSHETTRLALMAIEETLRPGDDTLDVGTGSGVLSIAAVKLGAGRAVAVDTDPLAVENARENAALNGVEGRVDLREGSVSDVDGTFDLAVANIISGILVPMLPALVARLKPSGRVILGGVLDREEPMLVGAVAGAGLEVKAVLREGEWVCVIAGRRDPHSRALCGDAHPVERGKNATDFHG